MKTQPGPDRPASRGDWTWSVEELLRALKELRATDATTDSEPTPTEHSKESLPPLRRGDKVLLIRNDRFFRRTGVVLGRRGEGPGDFWDVKLDPTLDAPQAQVIYKVRKYLLPIKE